MPTPNTLSYFIIPVYEKYIGNLERLFFRRFQMTLSLMQAYKFSTNLKFVQAKLALDEDIISFHSSDYIEVLKSCSKSIRDFKSSEEFQLNDLFFDEYGLSYDCVLSPSTYLYSLNVAGTSLACSNIANLYTYSKKNQNINIPLPIIFNFLGGWHHAQRSSASGYCYVNDIVICINDLKKIHTQILYIDLDLHHCDGVEEAFSDCNTNGTILIISIHHFSPGFFPGTGQLPQQINMKNSKNKFNINIPLKEGICDTNYFALFKRVIESIYDLNGDQKSSANLPDVIIIQCGADVLVGDPHKVFNLTPTSIINCVNFINTHFCQKLNIPLIILGGGGYNFADTSRCWVQLVASLSNMTLDNDIPEHTYFPLYGPSYELSITPGLKKDSNDQAYLNFIVNSIKEQIK